MHRPSVGKQHESESLALECAVFAPRREGTILKMLGHLRVCEYPTMADPNHRMRQAESGADTKTEMGMGIKPVSGPLAAQAESSGDSRLESEPGQRGGT